MGIGIRVSLFSMEFGRGVIMGLGMGKGCLYLDLRMVNEYQDSVRNEEGCPNGI